LSVFEHGVNIMQYALRSVQCFDGGRAGALMSAPGNKMPGLAQMRVVVYDCCLTLPSTWYKHAPRPFLLFSCPTRDYVCTLMIARSFMREDYGELLCSVFCTSIVHTRGQHNRVTAEHRWTGSRWL